MLTRNVGVTTPTLTHAIAKGTTVRTKPSTITEFSWFPAPRKGDEYEQVAREGERPGSIAGHRLVAPMPVIMSLSFQGGKTRNLATQISMEYYVSITASAAQILYVEVANNRERWMYQHRMDPLP